MPEAALQHLAERLAAGSVPAAEGVQLAELALPVKINLRGDPADAAFRRGVQSVLGLEPPAQANTFTRCGEVRCMWLGPDEWLIVAAAGKAEELAGRLCTALAGQHVSVVQVSSAYAALQLTGKRAREVLATACPLDLPPRAFRPGHCAHSHFAPPRALVALESDAPLFHLPVRRPFAAYLSDRLLVAIR